MDLKSFQRAIAQIAETRGISEQAIMETIEAALATAYKKDYGQKGQKIKAKFNPMSGATHFWQVKLVVDDSMLYTPEEIEEMKEKKIPLNEDFVVRREGPASAQGFGEAMEEAPKKIVFNAEKHVMVDEAKKMSKDIKVGEELEIPLQSKY